MKFTKEQVLENIKTSFVGDKGNTSLKLSDRTVMESIESLMAFATEDTELADFVSKVRPTVDSANRNLIKDQADFVKNYKPAEPPAPPVPPAPPTPPVPPVTPPSLDLAALAKLITDQTAAALKPIQDELGAIKAKEKKEKLFSEAKTLFEAKKPDPSRKTFADKAWNTVSGNITDATTPQDLATAYETEYNELCALTGVKGYIPLDAQGKPVENNSIREAAKRIAEAKDTTRQAESLKTALGLPTNAPAK